MAVGSLLCEFRIEETNGMYWVMGVTGDMATKTSVIFGSGGAVRPDQLGAPGAVWLGGLGPAQDQYILSPGSI
jgi:hypothetical protein